MQVPLHNLLFWIICVSVVLGHSLDPKQGKKYNILAFFPDEDRSHFIGFTPLLQDLAAKGHNLTIVSPYSIGKTRVPHHHIQVEHNPLPEINVFRTVWLAPFFFSPILSWLYGPFLTEKSIVKESVIKFINEDQSKFDLVLFENFLHEAYVVLGHKYGAPVIQMLSMGANSKVSQWHRNPINPAYIPDQQTGFVPKMNILQRSSNTLSAIFNTFLAQYLYLPWQQAIANRYFVYPGSWNRPPLEDLLSNVSLTLLNNHFIIGSPTPLIPSFINVAGMHCQKPKRLPKDLEAIVDASKDGIVYFSLGSNINSTNMPLADMYTILSELSKIRQIVFWKWDSDARPDIPPNVIIRKWFPQNDILGHPKCKMFITHGGIHSVIEATYFGVPMIALSFVGDQIHNSKYVQSRGYGIHVPYTKLSEATFGEAVLKLLHDPLYTENAKKISAIFNDNPLTPRENAIYWIEYVIRHGGAPHLQTSAKELKWFEYYLLDVIFLLEIGLCVVSYFWCKVTYAFFSLCCCCWTPNAPRRVEESEEESDQEPDQKPDQEEVQDEIQAEDDKKKN
ncbi:UDP-glycosyltransferase UGT5-like [Adelges cooleyi]|uniref:UDP-glycosyltransferase UGT5-like n=1 Tax=Adelges cooleyi TaxID=133065 RepID=UPI00217F4C7C|nr:UDP-glycosyltransferase UGT5-like [Adelges cooleyi]